MTEDYSSSSTKEDRKRKDRDLHKLAEKELIEEAKRAARCAEVHGAYGWQKSRVPKPNKVFFQNTLYNAVNSNSRLNTKTKKECKKDKE